MYVCGKQGGKVHQHETHSKYEQEKKTEEESFMDRFDYTQTHRII